MNSTIVVAILLTVVLVVIGFLAAYYKKRKELQEKAVGFIEQAESMYLDVTKAGGKRFEAVVTWLDGRVPAVLKPFITRDTISKIVQSTFDLMQRFAEQQLDKIKINV